MDQHYTLCETILSSEDSLRAALGEAGATEHIDEAIRLLRDAGKTAPGIIFAAGGFTRSGRPCIPAMHAIEKLGAHIKKH